MTYSDLFFGTSGRIISHTVTILILFMLVIVTVKLLYNRRKIAYFSLTLSLLIIIIEYIMLIAIEMKNGGQTAGHLAQLLHVAAFLLINMGTYQLYNSTSWRHWLMLAVPFGVAVAIAGFRQSRMASGADQAAEWIGGPDIWLNLYLVLLAFLAIFVTSPHIGQQTKYRLALLSFVMAVMTGMFNRYVLDGSSRLLELAENALPIVFYMILFFIVFNRVVELLQAIYQTSIKDPLTGLYNRAYFINRFTDFLGRGIPVSVIFCDIDNFKRLNDTLGHRAGDRVLGKVANILRQETNRIGIAGRYGGEELVALLTDTSLRVENIAEQIRLRVEKEAGATVSIGYTKYREGATLQQLLDEADMAMYRSKRSGKNRVTGYVP